MLIAYTDPPLTTGRQNVLGMSDMVVRALLDEIAGQPVSRAEYLFPPELIMRGSTTAYAPARPATAGG